MFGYEYANQSPVRLPLPIFSEIPPMPFTKWDDDLGMTAHMGMFAVKGQVYGFMGSSLTLRLWDFQG
jgi:hypothetical protein